MLPVTMAAWAPMIWPLSQQSLPTWLALCTILTTGWVRSFLLKRSQKGAMHDGEMKRDKIERTMDAILDYVANRDAQEAKGENPSGGLPEASRIMDLLWDSVHEIRTTAYGVEASDPRHTKTEALMKRVVKLELEKACKMTKQAQAIATGKEDPSSAGSDDDLKEVMEYWSGEKLQEQIDFVKDEVAKHLGKEFVDKEAFASAKQLISSVRKVQRKNMSTLFSLIMPVVPSIVYGTATASFQVFLQTVFHQIGPWIRPVELAVAGDYSVMRTHLIWLFSGHLLHDFLGMIQESTLMKAQANLCNTVKNGVLKCMLSQDYEFFDKTPPGVLQERLNRDADMLGRNIIDYPKHILIMCIRILTGLIFTYQTCPLDMFLMAVAPLAPIIALQYFLVEYFTRTDEQIRKLEEGAASSTSEVLREIKTVRQFAMETKEAAKYAFSATRSQDIVQNVSVYRQMADVLFGLTIYGGLVLTVYMGAMRVNTGELKQSEVVDITFKLNFQVVFTLRELITELPKATKLMQPLGRISELLQSNPKIEPMSDESSGLRPERFRGLIEFQDVHFAYPKDPRKPVLQGLTFTVEPGQKVALIGHTGCGKSSTMSLLQRLYQPQKGSIRFDGKDIQDYDIRYLRSRIVIVDQFTVLFATTVRENIIYGMDGAKDEEIEQACREAACWDFLQEKPDKLMTSVQVGGTNFSGGQRQRIAIARAIVRKPDVILLDEATASLDAENERLVQGALDKLAKNGSALVIAHRLSTIKDSDKIVVIDHGRKVEEGCHDKLLGSTTISEDPEEATTDMSKKEPPLPGLVLERATSDQTPNASKDTITNFSIDAVDLSPPKSPPRLQRMSTFHGVTVTNKDGGHVTYRKLWDAATGTQEKMTVHQMQQKIDKMESELASLKSRVSNIKAATASVLEGSDRFRSSTTDLRSASVPFLSRETSSLVDPGLAQAPPKLGLGRAQSGSAQSTLKGS